MNKHRFVYIFLLSIFVFYFNTYNAHGALLAANNNFILPATPPLPVDEIQTNIETDFILESYEEFNNFIDINEISDDLNFILNERLIQIFEEIDINDNIENITLEDSVLHIELKEPLGNISIRDKLYENLNIKTIIVEYDKEKQSLIIKGLGDNKTFQNIIYENPEKIIVNQSSEEISEEVLEMVIVKEKKVESNEQQETVSAQSVEEATNTEETQTTEENTEDTQNTEEDIEETTEDTTNDNLEEITLYTEDGKSSTFKDLDLNYDIVNDSLFNDNSDIDINDPIAPPSINTDLPIIDTEFNVNTKYETLELSIYLADNKNFPSEEEAINNTVIIIKPEVDIKDIEIEGKEIISESEYRLTGTLETISGQKSDYEMTVSLDGKQINETKISFMNPLEVKDKSEKQAIVKISEIDLIDEKNSDNLIKLIYYDKKEEGDKEEEKDSDLFEAVSISKKTSLENSLSKIFEEAKIDLSSYELDKITENIKKEISNSTSYDKVVFDVGHFENGDFVLNVDIGNGKNIKIKVTRDGRIKTAKLL